MLTLRVGIPTLIFHGRTKTPTNYEITPIIGVPGKQFASTPVFRHPEHSARDVGLEGRGGSISSTVFLCNACCTGNPTCKHSKAHFP